MTQWNSSYYRRKNYNRVIKGSIDSVIDGLLFLPVETEIRSAILKSGDIREISKDIRNYIAVSPSITFNLLNLTHSTFISGNRNIASFDDAIKMIGKDISINLIKDLLIHPSASPDSNSLESSRNNDFFISLKAAHLSALVSEAVDYSSSFTAYIAALIHNVGAVALSNRFPVQYGRLSSSEDFDYSNQVSLEDNTLGINHCFLGARMVEHWDSFPFISDAIFYHHHPIKKIKQANILVKLVYFSSMVYNRYEKDRSRHLETGKELFNLKDSRIDELISIAELKSQNRLLDLGVEIYSNNSELVYQPKDKREVILLNDTGSGSVISALAERVRKSADKKERFDNIGRAIHFLTGIDQIFYFRQNAENRSLDGIKLGQPEGTLLNGDLTVSIDVKDSTIVNSFLMGIEINSLDRVNNTEPAIFDLQIANLINTDGLFCLPLIHEDKISGVIVLGINNAGRTVNRESIERLRYFMDSVTPYIVYEEVLKNSEDAAEKNTDTNSIRTRKLIHEINNPLSAIKNYLKVLNMKLDDINVENDEIRIIDDELDRVSKLLKEFKSSSSEKKPEKTVSSLYSIISDTILLIKNSRVEGSEIDIYFEGDEDIPDIMIDKDAFRQVLINLINNSIEAMPQGGEIKVNVRYKAGSQAGDVKAGGSEDVAEKIEISVSDEGPGFPDHLKPNLFKKQATTKADHDGLGLLIVYELIKKMSGTVILDDNPPKGTCFKIILPVIN